ncbi:ATP-binding protein [Planctomicrobium piriforme]|uniref:Serine/threonine-protein kinase RsbW n=1 Tax=Planctomicrobium piriforme TaxID=1576369 RepID=A0A1I3HTY2_9PLAN|nr:ATP-binding protein [Planctomicrobium piriforme]SFI39226.1 serine/threonine-protein kinase RsbW [Planctomicrobium piriforme]
MRQAFARVPNTAIPQMADRSEFEIAIPSDTSRGYEVQERILGMLETQGYSDRDVFGVKLSLEEALVNAIKHGNGMDPEKSVRVYCEVSSQQVLIVIEDEGEGFKPEDVPDPTDDDNLEKPSGRGLMLMRAFMTKVEYNDRGNRVELLKHRSAEE